MIDTNGTALQIQQQVGLVLADERAYVTETATGLVFAEDTPIEVWGALVSRLIAQRKKLEWAIADAINWGGKRYGETYAQWVEQTGLSENTLANIAWVGRKVESSRRREDVDFAYYREVAPLDPSDQDRLIDMAADQGLTRYELRQAVKAERQERALPPEPVAEHVPSVVVDVAPEPAVLPPPGDQGGAWMLIADLAAFIRDRVMTKLIVVDGQITNHDRHCAATAERMVCSEKCSTGRALITRAELL